MSTTTEPRTIDEARDAGYTRQIFAESTECTLELFVRPNTDTDGGFVAYCLDEEELITVNGWLFDIIDSNDGYRPGDDLVDHPEVILSDSDLDDYASSDELSLQDKLDDALLLVKVYRERLQQIAGTSIPESADDIELPEGFEERDRYAAYAGTLQFYARDMRSTARCCLDVWK